MDRSAEAQATCERPLTIDLLLVNSLSGMVRVSIFSGDRTGASRRLELLMKVAPDLANGHESLISL
jgi:hypothetical protein